MPATITSATRVHQAIAFLNDLETEDIYFFAGKVDPWDDETSPDGVLDTYAEFRKIQKSNVFMKKAISDDSTLAIKRYEWEADKVWTPWDDDIQMNMVNTWEDPMQPYYAFVLDSSLGSIKYNVYMCIDNNYDGLSTEQPSGQATEIINYIDGYRWKFMFSVDDSLTSMVNSAFVPCPYLDVNKSAPHLAVEANTIPGTIDRLRIVDGGSGYNELTTIVITGDGTGATAELELDVNGAIVGYTIATPGSGYTTATVTITGVGAGADLTPVISPPKGHGYNAGMQLGANHALYRGTFLTDETGSFPATAVYRRVGLIRNTEDDTGAPVTGEKFDLSDSLSVSNTVGTFLTASRIIGNISESSAVLYYISGSEYHITDKIGEFVQGETIRLATDPAVLATIDTINNITDVDTLSGDIIYYENLQPVTRKSGQSETFIFSIEF